MQSTRHLVSSNAKKLFKLTVTLLRPGFNTSQCKMAAKMAVARIKLLRNKKEVLIRQMRRDIALLLKSGQDSTARVRVEHVMREQNVLAANDFIELFCELIVSRLTIISKQRDCPDDLKEGIASLLFAGPRCSEIPELTTIRKIFEKKYGADFVACAAELRPDCGVNRTLIDKLSVRTPKGEAKLKLMKEIAKEYQIEWNASESEKELLEPPEQRTEGPSSFVSASSMPLALAAEQPTERSSFVDTAAAAKAAEEAARQAIAAAEAAVLMAKNGDEEGTFERWVTEKCHLRRRSCGEVKVLERCEEGEMNRRHSYHPSTLDGGLKFDESPPLKSAMNRVHPNLPDYDQLNARFSSIKRN